MLHDVIVPSAGAFRTVVGDDGTRLPIRSSHESPAATLHAVGGVEFENALRSGGPSSTVTAEAGAAGTAATATMRPRTLAAHTMPPSCQALIRASPRHPNAAAAFSG